MWVQSYEIIVLPCVFAQLSCHLELKVCVHSMYLAVKKISSLVPVGMYINLLDWHSDHFNAQGQYYLMCFGVPEWPIPHIVCVSTLLCLWEVCFCFFCQVKSFYYKSWQICCELFASRAIQQLLASRGRHQLQRP